MSLPEILLWQDLRRGGLCGLQFRRQHPVGPYILDFYCALARLAVEVDGSGHQTPEQADHDQRRDAWLNQNGIRVLRVYAPDVLADRERERVLDGIAAACGVMRE
jgi:very-short-patch-repair endonuclease